MGTSPRLVTALTALAVAGATLATAALRADPNDAAQTPVPTLRSRPATAHRPAVPAFNALPKSHIVAAFLLHRGPVTLFTDTRGQVIGRRNPADGAQVSWSDRSRRGTDRHARFAR